MSRRKKLPHCFYCDDVTNGGLSRIDSMAPVCTHCAWVEAIDPETAFNRWIALGGDRAAAFAFAEQFNARRPMFPIDSANAARPQIGGAR